MTWWRNDGTLPPTDGVEQTFRLGLFYVRFAWSIKANIVSKRGPLIYKVHFHHFGDTMWYIILYIPVISCILYPISGPQMWTLDDLAPGHRTGAVRTTREQRGHGCGFLVPLLKALLLIWGFPQLGDPQNGWFIRENPICKWIIWGYPCTPFSGNPHMKARRVIETIYRATLLPECNNTTFINSWAPSKTFLQSTPLWLRAWRQFSAVGSGAHSHINTIEKMVQHKSNGIANHVSLRNWFAPLISW